jgi:hypothetical protein
MSDNFKIVSGAIGSLVNPGGSFTIPYPAGTTSTTFYADGHIFILNSQRVYTDPAQAGISFGGSLITITNNTAQPWVNGDVYEIQLNSVPVDTHEGDLYITRDLYVGGNKVDPAGITLASTQEVIDGVRTDVGAAPAGVKGAIDARKASNAEVVTGADTSKYSPPSGVKAAIDAATFAAGSYVASTQSEAVNATSNAKAITPLSSVQSQDRWSTRRFVMPYARNKISKIQGAQGGIAVSGILSVIYFGDSYAPSFESSTQSGTSGEQLVNQYGFRGCWSGVTIAGSYGLFSGAAAVTGDFASFVTGDTFTVPATGSLEFYPVIGFLTVPDCNRATVVYKISSGAGTFKVQTKTRTLGASWVDVATVDASVGTNGTLGTSVVTIPTGSNQVRVLNVSGTVGVVGALFENTTVTSGVIFSRWTRGGFDLTGGSNTISQANLTTLLGVINPDLVVICFQDYDQGTTALPAAWTLWSAARSTQSWVVVAPHLDSGLGTNRARNDETAAWCKSAGQDYFDATSVVKDYPTAVTLGWMADGAHLNSQGFQSVSAAFWHAAAIFNDAQSPSPVNVSTKSVAATAFTENGNSTVSLRTAVAKSLTGGFYDPAGGQNNVRNATSMTSVTTGPFALAAWITLPTVTNAFHSIFHTNENGGGYRPNGISCSLRGDGGLRVEFYQTTTNDYWSALFGTTQWTPGATVLIWLWRDASGVMRFGFNDKSLTPNQGFGASGSGTINPAQSIETSYVLFGGANNSPGAGSNLSIHECAFWNTDTDPRAWFTAGRPPGSPSYWYRLREGVGFYTSDASGNGQIGQLNNATAWLTPIATTDRVTANTTSTVTFNTALQSETIYNTSASAIASSTITLPTASFPGQVCRYYTHGIHTAVTMAGGTVVGAALTAMTADQTVAWKASATSGTWIRIQ